MKKTLTAKLGLALLLALAAGDGVAQDNRAASATALPQITLNMELRDLPGLNKAESFWEVSYQWRIADQRDFDQWSAEGEDPARQRSLGVLLSEQSFTRRDLASPENRRFSSSVRVEGELRKRLENAGRQPQIVWLIARMRIHDGQLGTDVIRNVTPVWGPYFFREGVANVMIELTGDGKLRWTTSASPPWLQGKQNGASTSQVPHH